MSLGGGDARHVDGIAACVSLSLSLTFEPIAISNSAFAKSGSRETRN